MTQSADEYYSNFTFLRLMFLQLLVVFPGEGGLVHPVTLHPEFPAKSRLVVCNQSVAAES